MNPSTLLLIDNITLLVSIGSVLAGLFAMWRLRRARADWLKVTEKLETIGATLTRIQATDEIIRPWLDEMRRDPLTPLSVRRDINKWFEARFSRFMHWH